MRYCLIGVSPVNYSDSGLGRVAICDKSHYQRCECRKACNRMQTLTNRCQRQLENVTCINPRLRQNSFLKGDISLLVHRLQSV